MSPLSPAARRSLLFPFAVLFCIDCVFLLLHVGHKLDDNLLPSLLQGLSDARFSLSTDGGYAEMFQYIKEFGIAALFLLLFQRERKLVYLGWSVLFFFLLLDDSIQIHETGGAFIANTLQLPHLFGVGPQAYGELLMEACSAVLFFPCILLGYYRADRKTRAITHHLIVLFACLVFCGVITDFFDLFVHYRYLRDALVVLEDGGEMLAMTCICTYVYRVVVAPQLAFIPDFQLPWVPQRAAILTE